MHPSPATPRFTFALLCLLSLFAACSRTPATGPGAPLMTLDGKAYATSLGEPMALLDEVEAGFSRQLLVRVVFPLKSPGNRMDALLAKPGVEIVIDPTRVKPGQEIAFAADGAKSGVTLSYYPKAMRQNEERVFVAAAADGPNTIFIDVFEPKVGGRVEGRIVTGSLHSVAGEMGTGEAKPEKNPLILHINNMPFKAVIVPGL